jgi:hypothetical protein
MEEFKYHDFINYKFHPSQLGLIMTPPKLKGEILGETCKSALLEIWIEETYGRKKDITNKYMEKGTIQEEESITLYSLVTKTFYKKNIEQVSNDLLTGTPDLYKGESIMTATEIKDIKTSWDLFTFFGVFGKPINKKYEWQMQGYMNITGAKDSGLVYCLVDTPLHLIEDAKRKLQWAMNIIDPEAHPEFQAQCEQIEKNMTFSLDIPKEHRWVEFKIQSKTDMVEEMKEKLPLCRKWLNDLNDNKTLKA